MFKQLAGARDALKTLMGRCLPVSRTEDLSIDDSVGRVLSEDVISPADLPGFDRAAMDGFAVRSSETRGASASAPVYLAPADAVPVRTGLPVPGGFDAVLMIEDARVRAGSVEVSAELHPFRNVSRRGEDVAIGDVVLKEGRRMRPPDNALLAALGIERVRVFDRPRVTVIPTGGELVARGTSPLPPGMAYETNGIMAAKYVGIWGGVADLRGIVPDDPDLIRSAINSGIRSDMVLLIGGTSVGEKDYAPRVLDEMGDLLVHGVAMTPGKPTSIGVVGETPVLCLPGYPVAALSALYLFARPAMKRMAHLTEEMPRTRARLSGKIASRAGYTAMVRVALKDGLAAPIMTTGAGILSSVSRADGFVLVPDGIEGIEAGVEVDVNLFEPVF